jgi:hypothetical protein
MRQTMHAYQKRQTEGYDKPDDPEQRRIGLLMLRSARKPRNRIIGMEHEHQTALLWLTQMREAGKL